MPSDVFDATGAFHDDFLLQTCAKYEAEQRSRLSEPPVSSNSCRLQTRPHEISSASILTDDFLLAACAQYEAEQRTRRTSALHDDFLLEAWCKYDADQRHRLSEPSAAGKCLRLLTSPNDSASASSPSGD